MKHAMVGKRIASSQEHDKRTFHISKGLSGLLIGSLLLGGCFRQYYTAETEIKIDSATFQALKNEEKYFVLHDDNRATEMQIESIAGKSIEAKLAPLSSAHPFTKEPKPNANVVMSKKNKENIVEEVHVYTNAKFDSMGGHFTLPYTAISRLDVYNFNEKASDNNKDLSVLGIVVAVCATIAIIVAASSSLSHLP